MTACFLRLLASSIVDWPMILVYIGKRYLWLESASSSVQKFLISPEFIVLSVMWSATSFEPFPVSTDTFNVVPSFAEHNG